MAVCVGAATDVGVDPAVPVVRALLRGGDLIKKNADHSYGGFLNRMAEAGTPVEAEAGFSRNMLMSALTGDDIAEIDCPDAPLELRPGDRVILSSDGLDTLSQALGFFLNPLGVVLATLPASLLSGWLPSRLELHGLSGSPVEQETEEVQVRLRRLEILAVGDHRQPHPFQRHCQSR